MVDRQATMLFNLFVWV